MKLMDGNDLYDSCSITLSSDGLIIRNVIPSRACRSSAYQFCCNQDLCNFLPSPPLPAFTTLTCAINDCCSPKTTAITSLTGELISENLFCCNYPKCNQRIFPPGEAIRCYTCDSRITGLKDCMILNTSSSHVYNSASSNPSESCAMIVGQAGKDLMTGRNYPAFTIRTFINNCINQSLGNVTYGGATFHGRIDCCSTSLCNIHPLYINLTSSTIKSKHVFSTSKVIVSTLIICLGFIFIIIGISLSIYRFRLNKSYHCYTPGIFSDGSTTLFLSSRLN
ncbi:unnamed protein product [Rotaria sp. Silwood1]|nr:unnamed protein product [Rotaria sp. Silwood1]CAF3456579.1 unnamed protein product [Rotaria sp. Silwood1]CAF4754505.1 unnamed protein product [Rotaria sp. Silwood1]